MSWIEGDTELPLSLQQCFSGYKRVLKTLFWNELDTVLGKEKYIPVGRYFLLLSCCCCPFEGSRLNGWHSNGQPGERKRITVAVSNFPFRRTVSHHLIGRFMSGPNWIRIELKCILLHLMVHGSVDCWLDGSFSPFTIFAADFPFCLWSGCVRMCHLASSLIVR